MKITVFTISFPTLQIVIKMLIFLSVLDQSIVLYRYFNLMTNVNVD